MQIQKTVNGKELTVALTGRLDTNTSPELEKEMNMVIGNVNSIIFDMANLTYVSSAGLRVLLMAQKAMNSKHGKMLIRHCNSDLMEIFDVTGFVDILNIEE